MGLIAAMCCNDSIDYSTVQDAVAKNPLKKPKNTVSITRSRPIAHITGFDINQTSEGETYHGFNPPRSNSKSPIIIITSIVHRPGYPPALTPVKDSNNCSASFTQRGVPGMPYPAGPDLHSNIRHPPPPLRRRTPSTHCNHAMPVLTHVPRHGTHLPLGQKQKRAMPHLQSWPIRTTTERSEIA